MTLRINKYLALSGVASRRHADNLIQQGRVTINGKVVGQLGVAVNESKDVVMVDGKQVSPEKGTYYLMMNKPPGFLVSTRDPHHKNLVTRFLQNYKGKVFPVGRLDYDSSGLLVFTNDGQLAFRLSHPRYKVNKTYLVVCKGKITKEKIDKLNKGIELEDGRTAPAVTRLLKTTDENSTIEITIHEGKKRQVRRMFSSLDHEVIHLRRIAFGNLALGNLSEGKIKHLNRQQLIKLKKLVGLK